MQAEFIWLIIAIVLFVIEGFTYTLVSIWFGIGAAAAMVAAFCGADLIWQLVVFIIVSALLLLFTRRFAKRLLAGKGEATNADSLVGKTAVVSETIDNLRSTGSVSVSGQTWSASSADDTVIEAGEHVWIEKIRGVHLIVRRQSAAAQNGEA